MTADESDKDHLEVVVHLDNQAVFVAADVEDNPVVGKKTDIEKPGLNLLWIAPSGGLGEGVPGLEGLFSITMTRLQELHQGSLGDDAHTTLLLLPLWEEKSLLPNTQCPSMQCMKQNRRKD